MTNLKKVLALALVFAMSFAMLANAAFTDQKQIAFVDEVGTLVSLGVIQGYPDGSFKPQDPVTRAEFAKMLYVVRMGTDDEGKPFAGLSVPFDDVKADSWAKGYISYMYSLGVIAGKGNNKFAPDDKVTGLEALKMTLVVLGYPPNGTYNGYNRVDELVGASWATNTLRLSGDAGLTERYPSSLGDNATRELCALILYNALSGKIMSGVDANKTLGDARFGLITVDGILKAVHAVEGAEVSIDGSIGAAEGYYSVEYTNPETGNVEVISIKGEAAYTSLGRAVKVLYKKEKNTNVNLSYGVVDTSVNQIWSGDISATSISNATSTKPTINIDGNKISFDPAASAATFLRLSPEFTVDVPYEEAIVRQGSSSGPVVSPFFMLCGSTDYRVMKGAADIPASDFAESNARFTLIDNTGDGRPDFGYLSEYRLAQVDDITSNSVTLVGVMGFTTDLRTLKFSGETFDRLEAYEGMAVNDYVWVSVNLEGKFTAVKAEKTRIVTGSTVPATAGAQISTSAGDFRWFMKCTDATTGKLNYQPESSYDVIADAGRRNYIAWSSDIVYEDLFADEYGILVAGGVTGGMVGGTSGTSRVQILNSAGDIVTLTLARHSYDYSAIDLTTDAKIQENLDTLVRFEQVTTDPVQYCLYKPEQDGKEPGNKIVKTDSANKTLIADSVSYRTDANTVVFIGREGAADADFYSTGIWKDAAPGAPAADKRVWYKAYNAQDIFPGVSKDASFVSSNALPFLFNTTKVGSATRRTAVVAMMNLSSFPDGTGSYSYGMILNSDYRRTVKNRAFTYNFDAIVDGKTMGLSTNAIPDTDTTAIANIEGAKVNGISEIFFSRNMVRIYRDAAGKVVQLKPAFPKPEVGMDNDLIAAAKLPSGRDAIYTPTIEPRTNYSMVTGEPTDDFYVYAGALVSYDDEDLSVTVKTAYGETSFTLTEDAKIYCINDSDTLKHWETSISTITLADLKILTDKSGANIMFHFIDQDGNGIYEANKDRTVDFIYTCRDTREGKSTNDSTFAKMGRFLNTVAGGGGINADSVYLENVKLVYYGLPNGLVLETRNSAAGDIVIPGIGFIFKDDVYDYSMDVLSSVTSLPISITPQSPLSIVKFYAVSSGKDVEIPATLNGGAYEATFDSLEPGVNQFRARVTADSGNVTTYNFSFNQLGAGETILKNVYELDGPVAGTDIKYATLTVDRKGSGAAIVLEITLDKEVKLVGPDNDVTLIVGTNWANKILNARGVGVRGISAKGNKIYVSGSWAGTNDAGKDAAMGTNYSDFIAYIEGLYNANPATLTFSLMHANNKPFDFQDTNGNALVLGVDSGRCITFTAK